MKKSVITTLLSGLLLISPLFAVERQDMQVTDLAADSRAMYAGERILLLVLTRSGCFYCQALMKNVMLPLVKSGVWDQRAMLRELELDTSPEILGFSGNPAVAMGFAERYGYPFTPSILFLDRCGREVGLRHTGYDGSDFFEFYLDKSVKQAHEWLAAHPPECVN